MNGENLYLALLLLLSMAITCLLTPRFIALLEQGESGFSAVNYEGKKILNAGGIVIMVAILPLFLVSAGAMPDSVPLLVFLAGLVALGLVDDLWGDKYVKGFRGHLGLLWKEKKFSTGLLKAVGGFSLALFVAAESSSLLSMNWLARGIFLALFANLFNLLDTRPAMAIKGFYLISLLFIPFSTGKTLILFFWVSLYAYLPWELSRKIMLGDTGAYLLGGSLGYIAIHSFSPALLYSTLIVLLFLHIFLEKYSLRSLLTGGGAICRTLFKQLFTRWEDD